MYVPVLIYDTEVKALLKSLDKEARKFDKGKYGLPPLQKLESIVYQWVYNNKIKEDRL
jgi:hypothetical protein